MINEDLWADFNEQEDSDSDLSQLNISLQPIEAIVNLATGPSKKVGSSSYVNFLLNRLTVKTNSALVVTSPSENNVHSLPAESQMLNEATVEGILPNSSNTPEKVLPSDFMLEDLWAENDTSDECLLKLSTTSTNVDNLFEFSPPIEDDKLEVATVKSFQSTIANAEGVLGANLWFDEKSNTSFVATSTSDTQTEIPKSVEYNELALELFEDNLDYLNNQDFSQDFEFTSVKNHFESDSNDFGEFSFLSLELSVEYELEKIRQEAAARYQQELRSVILHGGKATKPLAAKLNQKVKAYYSENSFYQYLNYIQQFKLLTAQQERALAIQMEAGDKQAKEQLILANLRLVIHIARRYIKSCQSLTLEDLVQEGNLGLIKAIEKYDYKTGFKLSTYATWWIRQTISRAVADKDRTIRLPVHITETLMRLHRASKELAMTLGREPTISEIACKLDLSLEKIAQLYIVDAPTISLNQPIDNDDDPETRPTYMARTEAALALGAESKYIEELMNIAEEQGEIGSINLLELTYAPNLLDENQKILEEMMQTTVQKALNTLPERERHIIQLRFGLDKASGGQDRTLEEVGQILGVTRERIRQIEAKVLRKLRHPRVGKQLRDFLR